MTAAAYAAPLRTLARRRFTLTAHTPRELVVPLLTPVLFALVIAPALKTALHTSADYESYVALGTVGLLVPLNTLFLGIGSIVDRIAGAQRELLAAPVPRGLLVLGNFPVAIATTWLQMLPLPRLELDVVPDALMPYVERLSSPNVETYLFDATTDLGIPTVYSVEVTPAHPRIRTVVMCATALDPADAVAKVLRECASGRVALQTHSERDDLKEDPDTFIGVFDGALHTGHPDNAAAFDFLLGSDERRPLSDVPSLEQGSSIENLRAVLDVLRARDMDAVAVDLTTDEAARVGFKVVRTIIPDLQPLSFAYRAQYKGHPRLYEAPRLRGYRTRPESELNPFPQPFA
jgi:hypothetical protein